MKKHFKFFFIYSISGLIVIGTGLPLYSEASAIKISGAETSNLFWWGISAKIVINSKISLFEKELNIKYTTKEKKIRSAVLSL
jgi:hypothetical protein